MPRRARKYSKRIQIWASNPSYDGFSGRDLDDYQVKSIWADLSTLDAEKSTINGIARGSTGIEIFTRKDPNIDFTDETLFFKINGTEFRILSVEDIDLEGIEVKVIASS